MYSGRPDPLKFFIDQAKSFGGMKFHVDGTVWAFISLVMVHIEGWNCLNFFLDQMRLWSYMGSVQRKKKEEKVIRNEVMQINLVRILLNIESS